MCLWNADGKHLNRKNHCHHHHYHHYYPHDAGTAGWPQITKWLQTRWLRDERWCLKKGAERERERDREAWQKHRTQGTEREVGDSRHAVMELCRWRKEGWQRRERVRKRERSVCISKPQGSGRLRWGNGPWDSYNVLSAATVTVNTQTHSKMSTLLNRNQVYCKQINSPETIFPILLS